MGKDNSDLQLLRLEAIEMLHKLPLEDQERIIESRKAPLSE